MSGKLTLAPRSICEIARNSKQGMAKFCVNFTGASMVSSLIIPFQVTKYPAPMTTKTGRMMSRSACISNRLITLCARNAKGVSGEFGQPSVPMAVHMRWVLLGPGASHRSNRPWSDPWYRACRYSR